MEDAHLKDITVEAELGVLSGVEDEKNIDEKHSKYTDPDKVPEFVNRTHCDSLAVALGPSHGAYKFDDGKGLQLDVLRRIRQKVPGFPLVLHGSSSIKKNIAQEINKFGGAFASGARSVTDDDLIMAIKSGVCKVNIDTDLRLLRTKVHRKFFAEHPDLFDPIKPGK